MNTILILFSAPLSAILYRMGGAKGYNTKFRDVGCSLISTLLLGFLFFWHWSLILVFGLTWGSLTTYWKRSPKAYWYHWLLTGIMYSVATLPFVFFMGDWVGFVVRTLTLGLLTCAWSELIDNDVVEELGRGAFIVLTLPLLFV
jgi:hypothetical protein